MKRSLVLILSSAIIGVLAFSAPVAAKTTKECQTEWRAHKKENQTKGITEKAYVEKCRSAETKTKESKTKKSSEKKTSKEKMTKEKQSKKKETKKESKKSSAKEKATNKSSMGKKKTAKECAAEWRANKKANQAAGITEKAYVEKCRSGAAMAKPKTMPAASSSMKKTSTSKTHEKKTHETMTHGKPGMGKPTGADQYATESQAKSHCSRGTVVWLNLHSKIYHFAGSKLYGHTKSGAYMCESEAMKQGMHAAKNEKHP
jgi:DNA polymerase III gamma/tau subunit